MTDVLELFEVREKPAEKPLPEEPRARFEVLLGMWRACKGPSSLEAQARLEEELLEMYRRQYPKRKTKVPEPKQAGRWQKIMKICEPFATERDEVIARHVKKHEEAGELARRQERQLQDQMEEVAAQVVVEPSESWTFVCDVSDSDYQDAWYAHGYAELRALALRKLGLEVKIFEVQISTGKLRWKRYELWSQVDEIGLEVLRSRGDTHLPLREWLEAAHARCLNPRVYNPMLPWGLEEKWGVKYGHAVVGEEVPWEKVSRNLDEEGEDLPQDADLVKRLLGKAYKALGPEV